MYFSQSWFSFWYSNRFVHGVSSKQKKHSSWLQSGYKMFPPSVFLREGTSNALSEVEKNHYAVLWASCLCIMLSHSHERGGKRGPEPRRTWSGVPCQDGLYTLMGKERRWGVNGKENHRVGGTLEVIVVGVSAGRCWSPCVWKCECINVFLTPRNCMFL